MRTRIEGSYGIDAPSVPVALLGAARAAFGLAVLLGADGGRVGWFVVGLLFLAQAARSPHHVPREVRPLSATPRTIEVETADMTSLPMADDTFGLVTANVAIQNIKDRELRRTAIGEMYRVVKPGGTILVVDIQYTGEYREDLAALGAEAASVRSLGPEGWFGDPFFASELVAARKP